MRYTPWESIEEHSDFKVESLFTTGNKNQPFQCPISIILSILYLSLIVTSKFFKVKLNPCIRHAGLLHTPIYWGRFLSPNSDTMEILLLLRYVLNFSVLCMPANI